MSAVDPESEHDPASAAPQPPWAGDASDFFEALGDASRRLAHSRIEQGIAEAHGLDLLAFRLMLHLHHGGGRVTELASHVVAYASHTSAALRRLEARGLVVRTPDPGDRRASLVRPTPAGLELSLRLRAELGYHLAARVTEWTPQELRIAAALLRRLADAL